MSNPVFSTHAIERFIERTGANLSIQEAEGCLLFIWEQAKHNQISDDDRVKASRYAYTGIVFVVSGRTIKTTIIHSRPQARTTLNRIAKQVLGKVVTYNDQPATAI